MKILTASQLREADAFTIANEPIASIDLMERAAGACVEWISKHNFPNKQFLIFCGPGNNGGDGLAIARMLFENKSAVKVFLIGEEAKRSKDFSNNLERLKSKNVPVTLIQSEKDFPQISDDDVIIDALFGTGISKNVSGLFADCISRINSSPASVISIDIPSGIFDNDDTGGTVVHADHTLTFQSPKFSFLFSSTGKYCGQFTVLDIGLDKKYIETTGSMKKYITSEDVLKILKPREKFSHKGDYGHSLLIAGSRDKTGAALLAASACLRSGTGLLTVHLPSASRTILQTALPEAMVSIDSHEDIISVFPDTAKYDAIGIGPGIGTDQRTADAFLAFIEKYTKPLVIDADALNILAAHPPYLKVLPHNSILTPHPGEFTRLAGSTEDEFIRHARQLEFSKKFKVIIVLKGAHTCITTPEGESWFNSTGNPGMAKGGSGDVLTGMITAFLAQGYSPLDSAILGTYLHGLAGDIAKEKGSEHSMLAGDIIENIPDAFRKLLNVEG
jgi:ADP-dependent NAD(P)H-hydrate dehydratase / NAD(P)H-hydrate epimerase